MTKITSESLGTDDVLAFYIRKRPILGLLACLGAYRMDESLFRKDMNDKNI